MKATTTARTRATKKTLAPKPANDAAPSQRTAAPSTTPTPEPKRRRAALDALGKAECEWSRPGEPESENLRVLIHGVLCALLALLSGITRKTRRGLRILDTCRELVAAAEHLPNDELVVERSAPPAVPEEAKTVDEAVAQAEAFLSVAMDRQGAPDVRRQAVADAADLVAAWRRSFVPVGQVVPDEGVRASWPSAWPRPSRRSAKERPRRDLRGRNPCTNATGRRPSFEAGCARDVVRINRKVGQIASAPSRDPPCSGNA
jgi:hypothetical protein